VRNASLMSPALAAQPKLLLLDEPLAGWDRRIHCRWWRDPARLRTETAILLIEHDMDAVFNSPTVSRCWTMAVLTSGDVAYIRTIPKFRRCISAPRPLHEAGSLLSCRGLEAATAPASAVWTGFRHRRW